MAVFLDSATVQKLTHESTEVRLRTLQQITDKLDRAFQHNEEIQMKPGELCKQLIRWFGFYPLEAPLEALSLLLLVLRSNYGDKAIKQLGLERFKREVEKVKLLLKHMPNELDLVTQIQNLLAAYKSRQNDELEEIIQKIDSLSLPERSGDELASHEGYKSPYINCPPTDYETPWSKPTSADYTALKIISDILANPEAETLELQNAFQHLQITMQDYPTEYMLQAPHVFMNIVHLYGEAEDNSRCPLEDIAGAIQEFLENLKQRLRLRRNVLAYAVTSRSQSLAKTQLKIEKALELMLDKSLTLLQMLVIDFRKETNQVWQIITSCMEVYCMQNLSIKFESILKLHKVCVLLKENYEGEGHCSLHRMKYLLLVSLLEDMIIHNSKYQPCTNIEFLEPLLRDYSFKQNFPHRYDSLKKLVINGLPVAESRYEKLQKYESCFVAAVELLKSPSSLKSADIIARGEEISIALQKLNSQKIAEELFNAIINCNAFYYSQTQMKTRANDILLKLMRLKYMPIKISIYKRVAMAVKKHIACLMNGENYCLGVQHAQLLDSYIVGLPLSTTLLLQLVYECAEGEDLQVRQHSEEILVLLLQSRHFLGEHWNKLLEILLPILPLLQCCTNSVKIVMLLQELFNPDSENLPFLTVLQGNIISLFQKEQSLRNEAVTRLIYILNMLPDKDNYVPNLTQISDVIPNDLCILKVPREIKRIFLIGENYHETETLNNLLNLLETRDIEPLIRKTTLMQLNIMCQHWDITKWLCNENAYYLVLQALENSMQVESTNEYTGAAIPAIGILCKVLLYDAELRRELADMPNIYVLLLRALCIYQNDIQLRQDACVSLFLLLFSNFVVVLGSECAQAPRFVANLNLPLNFELQNFSQLVCDAKEYEGIFLNVSEENLYLRQVLASNFCGSHAKVNKKYFELQSTYDFDAELQLTQQDFRLMKASMPELNVRRCLRAISNATAHKSVINASISLQLQLLLKDRTLHIPDEIAHELFNLISKYLQLPPGNEMDFILFEHLLELCELCISLKLPIIISSIIKALSSDFHHALITLLKNAKISIRLYYKLSMLLRAITKAQSVCQPLLTTDLQMFYVNLFELVSELSTQLFQNRDLLRVRCLLELQKVLSVKPLQLSDDILLFYSKRFINLSISLKSSTQTGAQWQRNCLSIASQLHNQMTKPQVIFKLNESTIRYLSGLCGHSDHQVRGLAWCLLTYTAEFTNKTEKTGFQLLDHELSYLPGGFMACCLCTLLDIQETIIVRRLAGNLFIGFMSEYEETRLLLEQHSFFQVVNEAISGTCFIDELLPLHFDHNAELKITNCDLISCYTRISIKLVQLNGAYIADLCETTFMYKLYEMFKLPPLHDNPSFNMMCADISQLYGMCYQEKFEFLQSTLCRDQMWLMSFYQLLNPSNSKTLTLVNMLQLLMVLCKDELAYAKICEQFAKSPEHLVKLFLHAFTISQLYTQFQSCALAALSLLLINAQKKIGEKNCFALLLERNMELSESSNNEHDTNQDNLKHKTTHGENSEKDSKNAQTQRIMISDGYSSTSPLTTKSAAASILIKLFRLFVHLFPTQTCKFDMAPTKTQIQVSETMSVLLKVSPEAQAAAKNLKVFPRILKVFKAFFCDFQCSATTYVRRYGEGKKMTIIKNFQLLLNIQLNWFSSPYAAITDELQALELSTVLMQIWPWLTHSTELKLLSLRVCSHHSEHSLTVCQQFSALIGGYSNSLLQLVIKNVIADTTRVKPSSAEDFPAIKIGLRVVINCCSCIEGRITICKLRMMDIFDGMHPFNLKAPKSKLEILHTWLQFWELFSRYPEGAQVRNLRALCDVAQRSVRDSVTRIYTLRILRNMSFLDSNRATLIASPEFICLVETIITQPIDATMSYEEQLHVCVSMWKLITGGVKYVAMVRSSNLAKRLRALRERLSTQDSENHVQFEQTSFATDLAKVLNVILDIFNS